MVGAEGSPTYALGLVLFSPVALQGILVPDEYQSQ